MCCRGNPWFDPGEAVLEAYGRMDIDMSMPFVILRNTLSGRTIEVTPKIAAEYLAHPIWSKTLVVVDSAKPEVLAPEYTIEDGERKPLKSEKTKTPVDPEKDSE